MSEVSTYEGPYARLREVIGSERSMQYDKPSGAYSQGYIDALNKIEDVVIELENALEQSEDEVTEEE